MIFDLYAVTSRNAMVLGRLNLITSILHYGSTYLQWAGSLPSATKLISDKASKCWFKIFGRKRANFSSIYFAYVENSDHLLQSQRNTDFLCLHIFLQEFVRRWRQRNKTLIQHTKAFRTYVFYRV